MKILIAGGTGFIGKALRASLEADGHTCLVLSRARSADTVCWDPQKGEIDTAKLTNIDAVINLAGSNIACRWTSATKREIRQSRVDATTLLSRTLAKLSPAPRVLINASAIGYYGIAPQGHLSEEAPAGDGFLASVCQEWEQAAAPAAAAGIRTVLLRTGVVLSPEGGALEKMLPAFKAGVGGAIGNGAQWMSWIALADLIGLIRFCIENDAMQGALNAVAPEPVTNAAFSKALAAVLKRPALFKIPTALIKITYGQMAEETLLSSTRCSADKAVNAGYRFRYPTLSAALEHLLGGK